MGISVVDLNNFYHTPLGMAVNIEISKQIELFINDFNTNNAVFVGFTPNEKQYESLKKSLTIYISLAQQGVLYFSDPYKGHHQVLSYENSLPIPDACIEQIIFLHAIENCHDASGLLDEAFRILKGNGKILVITPNRRGLWAQSASTPFGYGHPYTMTQLTTMLNQSNFTPIKSKRCLYFPPSQNQLIQKMASLFHYAGKFLFPKFSGLIAIQAIKSVYHPVSLGAKKRSSIIFNNSKKRMAEV